MATLIVYLMALLSAVGLGFLPLVVALHWHDMTHQLGLSHGFRCLFLWVVAPQFVLDTYLTFI